jgi:aspartate aminotransferase-like enzyme/GNAT superfamily N-acetyltransferase
MKGQGFLYKIATEPGEFQQIHRLNYRTFVEEIPQHPLNPEKILVDKFHAENTYCIGLVGDRVVGMVAVRGKRPFSLDAKVANLDDFLPVGESVVEVRLLAVEPEFRRGRLLAGLFRFMAEACIRRGYSLGVASGTLRQARLYSRMGFVPFGQPVGTAEASYQPMYITLASALKVFERLGEPLAAAARPISFLPGPVEVSQGVREAFCRPALSHRTDRFLAIVADTKELLGQLTGASSVALLLGSGTLGNDAVAAQLKLLGGRGLVLSNGEFGGRLIDHAERFGLPFAAMVMPWGTPYDFDKIEGFLAGHRDISWLWSTHCETSTGILNDLEALKKICRRSGVRLCMDCTSSLGTVPVDLRGVYLATSVSGKGLASFPGLALVFHNHVIGPDSRVPRYLDLGYYHAQRGVPFTHSSNLVQAVNMALRRGDWQDHFAEVQRLNTLLRAELEKVGLQLFAAQDVSSPAVLCIILPDEVSSLEIGGRLEERGLLLSFRSGYLVERNLIQICLMGDICEGQCRSLLAVFLDLLAAF